MPDQIRVTRAVRRCGHLDVHDRPCPHCTDGWVDVPVDEKCPKCGGDGFGVHSWGEPVSQSTMEVDDCPDCNGSGRRLLNWATGFYWNDEVLCSNSKIRRVWGEPTTFSGDDEADRDVIYLDTGTYWYLDDIALVLSDPSHRPEPMRWKQ